MTDITTAPITPATNVVYIDDSRFHALVDRLKTITETGEEALDKAMTHALIEIGGIAPASWEPIHAARKGRN